jgi:PhnB protein
MAKAPPDGYRSINPYIFLKDAARAIEFYNRAFGTRERMRMAQPDGRIGHAELEFGDSVIMLSDENLEMGAKSPQTVGGSPINLLLYVEDVDGFVKKAVDQGASIVRPVEDMFYGDRVATIADPFGYQWYIHTHNKDVTPEEMERAGAPAAGN